MKVCCLPVAGLENPYQFLMMKGLRTSGSLDVLHGYSGKFMAVLRTAVRHRPDMIHFDWIHRYYVRRVTTWTWINAPIFILELCFVRYVLGVELVWTIHNMGTHDGQTRRIDEWTRRRVARLCSWVRVFHPSTARRVRTRYGIEAADVRVVPEGSYVGYYENVIARDEARMKLGIDRDRKVLLYLGLIRPYKGLERLILAFKELARSDWELVLAGKPSNEEYAHHIESLCDGFASITRRLAFIPDGELQVYFAAADVVVLPFRSIENSGSVVLAMSFGRPVIAPMMGVLAERLTRQAELLYDGDVSNGLRQLDTLSAEELDEIGANNFEEVERFKWEDFARVFEHTPSLPSVQA